MHLSQETIFLLNDEVESQWQSGAAVIYLTVFITHNINPHWRLNMVETNIHGCLSPPCGDEGGLPPDEYFHMNTDILILWCKINLLFPLKHGFSSKIYISHITELKPLCISLFSFALILYQIPFNEVNVIIVLKSASFNLWLVSQSITSIHVVNSVIINLHNHLLKHPHVNLHVIIVIFFAIYALWHATSLLVLLISHEPSYHD